MSGRGRLKTVFGCAETSFSDGLCRWVGCRPEATHAVAAGACAGRQVE
ncbi:hypothetical protein HMPREF9123_1523 [Neisseria bacilliformis ATCC BAA-1200]|uniref:Uncharacterized protein n=1 Tax=Neisseria bacilliformis ATCC BAA-1200 TaxID=888742 RepID=F2BCR8_9NEIS|nr:hypothetical protein HMPREF9123_1523 [Neisseria bacilliformis ATCC BAA-1200]